ncbi:hypothetical protein C0J52_14835 [Blattella germanica]|nr:hypothetical protein C0J52_14835 [Blattella germanica]
MGLTLGGVNVFVNLFVGEISEDSIRGTLGCMRGVAADIGILFIYCLGPYLSIPLMSVVSIILPISFLVIFYWLPESPMYLLSKGKRVEAMDAYVWLRRGDIQIAEDEMYKLDSVVKSTAEKSSFLEMLKIRGTRKALIIAIVFVVVAQLSGMNVVFSYTSRIFQLSGSTLSPDISTIIVGIVNFFGSLAALFGADFAGRRFILISTQFFQGISLGTLGVYLYLKELGFDVTNVGILPVISLSVYCFCVVAGVATVGYVVLAETFRPEARGLATSVTSIITWALAFLSTKFHYALEAVMGSLCFDINRSKNCSVSANLISISYGAIQGWGSPSLPILRSNSTTLVEPITDEEESWLGSVPHLAALIASPLLSYTNQNLGRKMAGYFTAVPLVIALLIIIFATSITYYYIARILMGLTLVGGNVFINMYSGEISEDSIRGTVGCIRGVAVDLGILFIYCLGPYLSIPLMSVATITLPILFLVLFYWLPESPMFLLSKGKRVEAMDAYVWLRRGDIQNAEEEMHKLDLVVKSTSEKTSLLQLLKVRGTRKALIIVIVFVVVAQLSGINVVFSYTSRILEMSGSTIAPDIATIIVGFVNFSGSLAALFGADFTGRRFILISTQFLQGISLGGLGVYLYMRELKFDVSDVGFLPVICISVYCFSIVAGIGTVGYVVIAETFRPEARGLAAGVNSFLTWSLAFLSTKFHYVLEGIMGSYGCFWLYAAVSFAGTIFTYFQVPETKNRSLDSILRELNGDQEMEINQSFESENFKILKVSSHFYYSNVVFVSANIITISYGEIQGWTSPSIPLLRGNNTITGEEPLTEEQESWIGSLLFLGALVSSPVYSYINQNWGRKACGYLSSVPLIIGWILIIFANSAFMICVARFFQGMSLSAINIFLTMYMGEIADDGIRGALGNFRGLVADAGIIIIYLIGPLLSIRLMSIVSIFVPVLFLFTYFWLPESPMFLLGKGKSDEAKNAYLWFRGGNAKAAEEEMSKLNSVMANSANNNTNMKDLLSVPGTRKALSIVLVLATSQQFSGMNVVFSYCAMIFEMTGSNLSPELSAIIFSIVNFSGSLYACFCSDLAGRRLILIVTQILQGICLGSLGIYLYARHIGIDVTSIGILPVICVSLYCFCVVAGPANLFYVVSSEIFRPEARGVAMNISSTYLWILAFLSTKYYSLMVDVLGPHGCFAIYAGVSFAGAIFIFFQLQETKNRSLESILRELNGESSDDSKSNIA